MRKIVEGGAIVLALGCIATGSSLAAAATKPNPTPLQERVQPYSIADRERRLTDKALAAGSPVMIRIFKEESQLELWMRKDDGRFELFESYPICSWSGRLGPKIREGDHQAPEGFYSVDATQLHLKGRNARSFYIDFPNTLDRTLGRTGSAIMVHGSCRSIGCFAMTDPAMEEIFALVEMALRGGQDSIEVHAFPFRMTSSNLAARAQNAWHGYWLNLKEAYDAFEAVRVPPRVSVCGGRYVVEPRDLTFPPMPDIRRMPGLKVCEAEVARAISNTTSSLSQAKRAARQERIATTRRNASARQLRPGTHTQRAHTRQVAPSRI